MSKTNVVNTNKDLAEPTKPCEFCDSEIDYIQQCDDCGAEVHEQCLDNNLCPYCIALLWM